MENQNTNSQGIQGGQPQNNPQQSNAQNQVQRVNNNNSRPQPDRSRFNQDRKNTQERAQNPERNRSNDRNQASDRSQPAQDDRTKGQNDPRYNQKSKDRRDFDRNKENSQPSRFQQNLPGSVHSVNNQGHFAKNPLHNTLHGELPVRHIKPKRIETVEDIQADTERIEKDIQFEIKQIRAAKLGL